MPRRSGPDLFRILADLEGLGIAVRELIDSGLELRALSVFVASDRAAHAFKLDRQHRVTQRFPADVGLVRLDSLSVAAERPVVASTADGGRVDQDRLGRGKGTWARFIR